MKITRSQKICFGLLGAGLIALVADRSFGGSTETAAAAIAAPAIAIRSDETPARAVATSDAGPSLAARLRTLVPDDAMGGPFADAFQTQQAAVGKAVNNPANDVAVRAFKSAHTLKAVLGCGRGGRVLLDDQLVAVGESVGGSELVDVREQHAVFAGPAGRIVLEVPGPWVGR